eukprot:5408927-Pleurochrysis_carterae.AAC.1
MSFNDGGEGQPLWYGGIIGPEVDGASGHYCGFDDPESRLVTFEEARMGVEMGSLDVLSDKEGEGGLCGRQQSVVRALNFISRKNGQQRKPKVVGVLLGDPRGHISPWRCR